MRDVIGRESSKETRDQKVQAAAGSQQELEHCGFKVGEPIEDFFSELPLE